MKHPTRLAFFLCLGAMLSLALGLGAQTGSTPTSETKPAASVHRAHRKVVHKVVRRSRKPVHPVVHHIVHHTTRPAHRLRRTRHVVTHRRVLHKPVAHARLRRRRIVHRRYVGQTWTSHPYKKGLGADDITAGEDPVVRAAAVHAMGDLNGTAVVVDPNDGRILAMVNQGLALSSDYQPCSTTKMAVSLAALHYGIVNENTLIPVAKRWSVNMTQALAWSINAYFEELGRRLGFERVSQYERMMGLGEKAGWDIAGESPGIYPTQPGKGGVAKLCSFGEGIHITPLQLASIVMSIANGGTLYYLQHPTSLEQEEHFVPRIKRHIEIGSLTPEVEDGMMAAVQYGTARLAKLGDERILGKTGTCSRGGTRFGLFASYLGVEHPRMVIVVILRGNRAVYGPRAAEIGGEIYKTLDERRYFAVNRALQNPELPAMTLPLAH